MEVRPKKIWRGDLRDKIDGVMSFVAENGMSVVAVIDSANPDAPPQALIVSPDLMRVLSDGYDRLGKLVQAPEYGKLRAEVARLRTTCRTLLGEVKRLAAKGDGRVSEASLNALLGPPAERQSELVRLDDDLWQSVEDGEWLE